MFWSVCLCMCLCVRAHMCECACTCVHIAHQSQRATLMSFLRCRPLYFGKIGFYFMCRSVLLHVCMCTVHLQGLRRPEGGVGSSETSYSQLWAFNHIWILYCCAISSVPLLFLRQAVLLAWSLSGRLGWPTSKPQGFIFLLLQACHWAWIFTWRFMFW